MFGVKKCKTPPQFHVWIFSHHGMTLSDTQDHLSWRWTQDGNYSTNSYYRALFFAPPPHCTGTRSRKHKASLRIKFFAWPTNLDRCWTSTRLTHHGLPHADSCALCDHEPETTQHLLIGCPFSQQVWHDVLVCHATVPVLTGDGDFLLYWASITPTSPVGHQKCLASLVILMAWSIWCFHNMCPFDNARPSPCSLCWRSRKKRRLGLSQVPTVYC